MDQHLTSGEWSRWLDSDRQFKSEVMDRLIDHGERLARIEANKTDAARAEQAAVATKKWAVVGGSLAAIINGFLLVFGGNK